MNRVVCVCHSIRLVLISIASIELVYGLGGGLEDASKSGAALPAGTYSIPVWGSNDPQDHTAPPPFSVAFFPAIHLPVTVEIFYIISPLVLLNAVIDPFVAWAKGDSLPKTEPAIT